MANHFLFQVFFLQLVKIPAEKFNINAFYSNNNPAVQGRSASFNSRYSGAEVESQPYVAGGVAVGPSSVSNQSVATYWAVDPRMVVPS